MLDPAQTGLNSVIDYFIKAQIGDPTKDVSLGTESVRLGYDVYDKRLTDQNYPLFKKPPYCVYFYYLFFDPVDGLQVRHYFYPDGDPTVLNINNAKNWPPIDNKLKLKVIVTALAVNARKGSAGTDPVSFGSNFNSMRWHRRSWVVFMVDQKSWNVHKRIKTTADPKEELLSAIIFSVKKIGLPYEPNYSFFDAEDLDITVENDSVCAVAFINHMKKDDTGQDMAIGDHRDFQFNLFTDVRMVGANSPVIVVFDPGTGNDGPPLDP
jgi:hypothetical protein